MRDTGAWCRSLEKKLTDEVRPMSARRFVQIELALQLCLDAAPSEGTTALPALLSGFRYVTGYERAIATGRTLLASLKNPHAWETALVEYETVPEHVRGYCVTSGIPEPLPVTVASERFDVYARTLSHSLPHRKESRPSVTPGTWIVRTRGGRSSVRIPEALLGGPHAAPVQHSLPPARPSVAAVDVGWDDLLETASWMDAQSAPNARHWRQRLSRVAWEIYDSSGGFVQTERIRVDRLLHVAGMVSSGKSTLMDVLAVWAARNGRRVTLVVGDVVSALRRSSLFRSFGLRAAPVLGRSNRRRHAERLHRVLETEGRAGPLDMADPAFDFLSTACAVDGLREHAKPFEPGDTPCESFHAPAVEGEAPGQDEGHPHMCPFHAGCQQHRASRDLWDSDIWVTTPAALVYTRVPVPMLRERLRYAELVYRTQDLVIVDEADQVQVQLDLAFSPHESLFGGVQGSWFDDLEERVGQELRNGRRRQLHDAEVARWVNAVDMARTAGNRIYGLLTQHSSLRRSIGRQHFTEWSLAARLARELSGLDGDEPENESTERFREAFRVFNLAPLGVPGQDPGELVALAQRCLTAPDDAQVQLALRRWLQRQPHLRLEEKKLDGATLRLELLLLVAVLASRLETLIRMWRQVELPLRLDSNSALFHRPPEDFRPVVPDAPMGNTLGFQYLVMDEGQEPTGELRFFRCMGVGRWLLLHLHELFDSDGSAGPNVLMLSGTSWAGASPSFHVQVPVGALLRAPQAEVDAIASSRFSFHPFFDAENKVIRVSGAGTPDARRAAIRGILAQLAGPGRIGARRSQLERELLELPEGRRRALLLVGSYADARKALDDLLEIQSTWRDRAVCLVPDDDEDGADIDYHKLLRRADVERFGKGAADILIAPLLAVERGHNILNEEQRAAVGVAYVLVRPMPRPDDMSFAVLSMNRRAIERSASLIQEASARGVGATGKAFREDSFERWRRLVGARMSWASLDEQARPAVTWNQLVSLWQVIGRLVRGGAPAKVVFVDGAFSPVASADATKGDTAETSLLVSFREVLEPYFQDDPSISPRDREVARALYAPLRAALQNL